MTYSAGVPLASGWMSSSAPPPDSRLSTSDTVFHRSGVTPTATNAKIEAKLKRDGENRKKEGSNVLKVLLLGQAGSGKSTTLKNFRMKYAREEWEQERLGWRVIVQFNVVRQLLVVVRIVESEIGGSRHSDTARDGNSRAAVGVAETRIPGPSSVRTGSSFVSPSQRETTSVTQSLCFTEKHHYLIAQLRTPLIEVERELQCRLTPHEIYYSALTSPMVSATPFGPEEKIDDDILVRTKLVERSVRSWKDVLDAASKLFPQPPHPTPTSADSKQASAVVDHVDGPTQVIYNLKNDIKALWADGDVRAAVKRRRLDISDSVGFDSEGGSAFLDEIDRIARMDYNVTNYDIVRARLKTVGVQEYKFSSDTDPQNKNKNGKKRYSWRMYDVGGCRTARKAWLPYFDDVQAIIFLSPVSVFDERLEEDPRVNRLEDSITLWSSICETPLLAKTQLILFLNKCDLLRKKLDIGVQVARYLPSYGKRPNDPKSVVKYMKEKFKTIHREKSPTERALYIYPTTVTDTISTSVTLEAVRDNVVRRHIASSQLV